MIDTYKRYFSYREGELFWREIPTQYRRACIGDRAGYYHKSSGYRRVKILGLDQPEHKVIWEYFNGTTPTGYVVDHINRNKVDNRIENLRLASRSENSRNKESHGYTSNFKGVSKRSKDGKWVAQGDKYLGLFSCELEAALFYNYYIQREHKDFANFNKVFTDVEFVND